MRMLSSRVRELLTELRRRHVFKVMVGYSVAAWFVIQAGAVLFPLLHLPAWGPTMVAVLVILGFPLAIVLSWAYDATPNGIARAVPALNLDFDGGDTATMQRPLPQNGGVSPRSPETPTRSVAVLPFLNMSSDPEQEYFSDGITEELLHVLAQIPELRVAARTSSFAFKGQNVDVREVGEKLGVATVLEGSVRKGGDRIRLTAQLIGVADGYHLWSRTFDRELSDVFKVQDEISCAIAEALRCTLIGGDSRGSRAPTDNMEAYELYLRGRYHFHKWDEEPLLEAISLYEGALEKDPDYALAHAGLADAYVGLMNFTSPGELLPKARAAASRALELDPALPEPHVSTGVLKALHDRDWHGAERCFLRAIELNPNESAARAFYVLPLIAGGRLNEALATAEAAQRLDPLSIIATGWRCVMLYYMGRYEEAVVYTSRLVEIHDSDYPEMRGYLGLAQLRLGSTGAGVATLREAVERSDRSLMALAYLARGLALCGEREEATELLREIESRRSHEYVSSSFIAAVHLALGDRAAALDHLDEAATRKDMELAFLGVHPDFSDLRAEPRFRTLLGSLGLTMVA